MAGCEAVRAFFRREGSQQRADLVPEGAHSAGTGFAQVRFEFGEELLDRVQVRRVGRQIQQYRAGLPDGFLHSTDLVAAEIVQDDDVTWLQCWNQHATCIGQKHRAIHRPIGDHGGDQAVLAEATHEGCRLPVTVGHGTHAAATSRRPATTPHHVRGRPGFVDKDQSLGINPEQVLTPHLTCQLHVGSLLLAGVQGFF